MSVDTIELWHKRARPNPTDKDFNVQLGCHIEEFREMLDCLRGNDARADVALFELYEAAGSVADGLKSGALYASIIHGNREYFLDSLADQIVTATGVGHCAGMRVADACYMVNSSNWSKFDADGQPIFDANGKVTKGPGYEPPNLEGLY